MPTPTTTSFITKLLYLLHLHYKSRKTVFSVVMRVELRPLDQFVASWRHFAPHLKYFFTSKKKWMESPDLGLSWGCQKNDLHGVHRMIGWVNFLGPPNFLASYWWFYDEAFQMRGKRLRYQKKNCPLKTTKTSVNDSLHRYIIACVFIVFPRCFNWGLKVF